VQTIGPRKCGEIASSLDLSFAPFTGVLDVEQSFGGVGYPPSSPRM
jgi:hypothetical protein